MTEIPIAITCGDPAGVGPEIIEAWLRANPEPSCPFCVIGPHPWVKALAEWAVATEWVGPKNLKVTPGQPTVKGAEVAFEALEVAAAGCREGLFRAVVTGPVSKLWMQQAGFPFPGQTEFFAERWEGDPTMAFVGQNMRVILATWHIPLTEVASHLNHGTLSRAVLRAEQLVRRLGVENPRIGVCGLNPHAGEKGLLGEEEEECLNSILNALREDCPGLSKCEPGDTLFWRHLQGEFDAVIALYHDQGLGPLKTIDFNTAVNVTLGLPWVRTSPDHGTGFAIAGKGCASVESFSNAVSLAQQLSQPITKIQKRD